MPNDNAPIVYLIQEPTSDKDLSSAAQYGKIIPLISSTEKPSSNIGFTLNKLMSLLRNFQPEDYICFAGGDPISTMLTGVAMERVGFTSFNYLSWNRERDPTGTRTGSGFYMPKTITIFKEESEENEPA